MKKIISLFQRNYDGDRLVRNEVTPGAEWVINGEGTATQKLDGTCCLVRGGNLFKRYEVKRGGNPPVDFEPACGVDPVTGKQQGWRPVGDGPEDQWHREAWDKIRAAAGTFELIGPMIQGNPERMDEHQLERHGEIVLTDAPRSFDALKIYLKLRNIEGIVWHHPDGRMVKIKTKDFGFSRCTGQDQ